MAIYRSILYDAAKLQRKIRAGYDAASSFGQPKSDLGYTQPPPDNRRKGLCSVHSARKKPANEHLSHHAVRTTETANNRTGSSGRPGRALRPTVAVDERTE